MKDWFADSWEDIRDEVREHSPTIVFGVILIGVGVWFYTTAEEEISVDKQTQCPIDVRHIRDYALVLLDGTDNIVGEYAEALHKEVSAIARTLPRYGKISLHDVATGKNGYS